jgi:energy-coupling factor transport system substrate-specific component
MRARELTRIGLLATFLYVIQFLGSFILYFEWVNFIILLYGVYLNRKEAWLAVITFCFLIMLTRGVGLWSIMYFVVFPQYVLIYSFFRERFKNEYALAALGFVLAFMCGTLIDLPFMLTAGLDYRAFIIRLFMGFQVSLSSGIITFISTLYLLNPLKRIFNVIKY